MGGGPAPVRPDKAKLLTRDGLGRNICTSVQGFNKLHCSQLFHDFGQEERSLSILYQALPAANDGVSSCAHM